MDDSVVVDSPVVTELENGMFFYLTNAAALLLLVYYLFLRSKVPVEKGTPTSRFFFREIDVVRTRTSSSSSLANYVAKDDECEICTVLGERFPDSTVQERKRFSIAHPRIRAASKQLQSYLEWKEKHRLIRNQLSEQDPVDPTSNVHGRDADEESEWNRCVDVARVSCNDTASNEPLPRVARMYCKGDDAGGGTKRFARDLDGMRMLHVMPGQLDATLAHPSTYALTLALYIDQHLERSSMEQLTVLIDVRGGEGWPNTMPHHQLPFIQNVTKLLLALFPERCHKCILYPMPQSALWIWNLVKVWLDPKTASKMVLLVGPATIKSPPPREQMEEHMDKHTISMLEEERQLALILEPPQ